MENTPVTLLDQDKNELRVERDMQMDELAMFWGVRTDEFGTELTMREETSCCGTINIYCPGKMTS